MELYNAYQGALLAEASYADLEYLFDSEDVKKALIKEEFSERQAAEFVETWRVVNHLPNTSTGFSATVYERIENPGEVVFAIRGTEVFAQWSTDVVLADLADIGADGIALNQAIDLMNYYQRLITKQM